MYNRSGTTSQRRAPDRMAFAVRIDINKPPVSQSQYNLAVAISSNQTEVSAKGTGRITTGYYSYSQYMNSYNGMVRASIESDRYESLIQKKQSGGKLTKEEYLDLQYLQSKYVIDESGNAVPKAALNTPPSLTVVRPLPKKDRVAIFFDKMCKMDFKDSEDAYKGINAIFEEIEKTHAVPGDEMLSPRQMVDKGIVTSVQLRPEGGKTIFTKGHMIEIDLNGGFRVYKIKYDQNNRINMKERELIVDKTVK